MAVSCLVPSQGDVSCARSVNAGMFGTAPHGDVEGNLVGDCTWEVHADIEPKDEMFYHQRRQNDEELASEVSSVEDSSRLDNTRQLGTETEAAGSQTPRRLHEPNVLGNMCAPVEHLVTESPRDLECCRGECFVTSFPASIGREPSLSCSNACAEVYSSTEVSAPRSCASLVRASENEDNAQAIDTACTTSPLRDSTILGSDSLADGPMNSTPFSLRSEKHRHAVDGHACSEDSIPPSPISLDMSIDADEHATNRCDHRAKDAPEKSKDKRDSCTEPFEYTMLDYIGKCPRIHAQLSCSMRHSRSLLHSLRVQSQRCLRLNPSTTRPRPLRPSPGLLPGKAACCDVNARQEADELPSLSLAVECVTLVCTEVAALTALHQKLHHAWNVSGKRLAVSQQRANHIKQQRLKDALMDVVQQTKSVDTLMPIHDGAVKEATEAVRKQIVHTPRAGWCNRREACIRNLENQIEMTSSSLSRLSTPIVCSAKML
eukprot:TRINITY_DN18717_c0_g1_i2.p1 TRINITY_DN18717_c0_g1~~TRINITY_DN18717_c0_g1_i2.p1  ORF type:complete len:488 (-),score=58.02 TRINITY_DN18717_c0_g1_i2:56-1519(-)